jgi:glutamine amidotransferase
MNVTPEIIVIDYGLGNLLSVCRGLECCGAKVKLTADPNTILSASRVLLPGVGAFDSGIAELRRQGLDSVVREVAAKGVPLLGVCLGMQLLFDESEEFGISSGLGVLSGKVVAIPIKTVNGQKQKIPQIGWNGLVLSGGRTNWEGTLLQEVVPGESVYFVHSFMVNPSNPDIRIADCIYGGWVIPSVIEQENIVGCQFHPEKSGAVGLKILRGFLSL